MARSSNETPKIILVGKSSGKTDNSTVKKILANIEPSDIPVEFIHSIMVTTEDGNIYNVPEVKQDISYKNMEQYIHRLNIKGRVKLVEILINLDTVKEELEFETNKLLDKVFRD